MQNKDDRVQSFAALYEVLRRAENYALRRLPHITSYNIPHPPSTFHQLSHNNKDLFNTSHLWPLLGHPQQMTLEKVCAKANRGFIFYFYVLFSTMHHLPPIRFHCFGGCWDRNPGLLRLWYCYSQTLWPLGIDHIHNSARSHPLIG